DPSLAAEAALFNVTLSRLPLLGPVYAARAEGWFTRALARNPDAGGTALGLGLLRLSRGQPADATDPLRHAVERAPRDGQALLAAAEGLKAVGDGRLAFELEARAVDTVPDRCRPETLGGDALEL